MKSLVAVISLGLLLGFSLACSRSKGGSVVSVSGTFDDSATPGRSKALDAASTYDATAEDPVSGQTFAVTVNSTTKTYTTSVFARTNLRLKIKKGGYEVLSRIFPAAATAGTVSGAKVNIVTHVQAQMVAASVSGGNYDAAVTAVNTVMFGTTTPAETDLTIAKVASVTGNATFAARISIMAQLVASTMTDTIGSLVGTLVTSFQQTTVAKVETAYQAAVNSITSSAVASVYASAVVGAQTNAASNGVSTASLNTIISEPTNSVITSALVTAGATSTATPASPVFGSAVDTQRTAAPGVLFQYTFPTATTTDALGVSGYSGAWSATPGGVSETTNSGRTLKFLPSYADIGKSFVYTLTATGGNGKTVTTTVTVAVKSLEIKGVIRKQLAGSTTSTGGYYKPKLGPKLSEDGAYLYLVAYYSNSLYRLEKYEASSVTSGADLQSLSLANSWAIPSAAGAPRDFALSGSKAYIATAYSGVIGYDLTASSSTPDYTATTMSATRVTTLGDYVYGLYGYPYTMSGTVKYATKTLASVTAQSDLTTKASSLTYANELLSYGSYIYLSSWYTSSFYNPSTASFTDNYTPSTSYSSELMIDAGAVSGVPAYLVGNYTGYKVQIGASNALTTASLPWGSSFPSTYNDASIGNGAYGFKAYSNDGSIFGFSLEGTSARTISTDDTTTGTVGFSNLIGENDMDFAILNKAEGITSGRSGAYLFALGQYPTSTNTATMTGTWYMKAYRLQPGE